MLRSLKHKVDEGSEFITLCQCFSGTSLWLWSGYLSSIWMFSSDFRVLLVLLNPLKIFLNNTLPALAATIKWLCYCSGIFSLDYLQFISINKVHSLVREYHKRPYACHLLMTRWNTNTVQVQTSKCEVWHGCLDGIADHVSGMTLVDSEWRNIVK